MGKAKVRDYMSSDVVTVSPDDYVGGVVKLIHETKHKGFPVVSKSGHIKGYLSAYDLLLCKPEDHVSKVMTTHLLVTHPDMDVSDAARVIFRSGISRLPVVDDRSMLIGIISNADVIRSQIERSDLSKVHRLKETLEDMYGVEIAVKEGLVEVNSLVPTQPKIYADELEGRIYELEKGLAESIVVVKKPGKTLLIDGHHRVVAAKQMGVSSMEAYILVMKEDMTLGMEKSAEEMGLRSVSDIKILDYASHPLVEVTERLLKGRSIEKQVDYKVDGD